MWNLKNSVFRTLCLFHVGHGKLAGIQYFISSSSRQNYVKPTHPFETLSHVRSLLLDFGLCFSPRSMNNENWLLFTPKMLTFNKMEMSDGSDRHLHIKRKIECLENMHLLSFVSSK